VAFLLIIWLEAVPAKPVPSATITPTITPTTTPTLTPTLTPSPSPSPLPASSLDSLGDRLLLLLLGAAFALLAQLFVQYVVVPRVEARKRREDRWEQNVLALGELLTTEVSTHTEEARHKSWLMQALHRDLATATDVNPARRDEVLREVLEEARSSLNSYKAVGRGPRAKWLVDRIVSLNPKATELIALERRWQYFQVTLIGTTLWDHVRDDFTDEAFEDDWRQFNEASKKLLDDVQELARRHHPPRKPAPTTRLWRWIKRRRKQQQAQRDQVKAQTDRGPDPVERPEPGQSAGAQSSD
jgi:hypothetical protein